ncbi:EAL domain-containing protein [Lysobacter korlensis]|uniref:EAL domain-containing protein n=1 Tax=Lysobacter korlensis TaxID=553636 RepID=A0ABV6RM35_9GAMM
MSVRPFSALAIALCLLAALLVSPAWAPDARAGTRDFHFNRLGREHGLRQSSVTAIVQDGQGFIWVGTQGGLHRFDGQRYTAFRHDPRDAATLPDSFITALAVDDTQRLWVGTNSQYVSSVDLDTGSIRRYTPGPDATPADGQVRAVLPQGDRLWIGTSAGLKQLDPRTGTSRTVMPLADQPSGLTSSQSLVPAADGGVWFGASSGLHHVAANGQVIRVGPAAPVRSLEVDARGRLWVGRLDGLDRLEPDGRSLRRIWPGAGDERDGGEIRSIAQAPDGHLWLSVFGKGLVRFNPDTGATRRLHAETRSSANLPENTIETLFIDAGGMLWAGSVFRGVGVADTRGTRFSYVLGPHRKTSVGFATGDSIRAIAEDDDRSLWLGTDNARLLRYEPASDSFQDHTERLPDAPAAAISPRARVQAIADAGQRRFWLATSQGLYRFDTERLQLQRVELPGLPGVSLRSVLVGRNGDLWLGTHGRGLVRYRPQDGSVAQYSHRAGDPASLPHPVVFALLEDRRGRIWVGTGDGLAVLDPTTGGVRQFRHVPNNATSLPANIVRALHQDAAGQIWVGSHAGLSRVVVGTRPDGGEHISFVHPLAESAGDSGVPVVFTIAERPPGRLWLGTDQGIVRFGIRSGRRRNYGIADGLQDLEFNGGAVGYLADGRLAFGGVSGLNLFDPARERDSTYTPPLRLLSARIDSDAPDQDGMLWRPERIEVPATSDLLRLRIGALDYSPAAQPRYRYRMDGFDRDWIDNGIQQDITYTRLPPGDYVFRAQAGSHDNGWNPNELRIPVQVAAPLWRHPLVLAAAAIMALAALGLLGWQLHLRRLRERGYFAQIREREERLKLALWASGEQFWDFDLRTRALHRMRVDEEVGPTPFIGMQSQFEANHEIHPDDLPRVLDELRRHLRGQAALFLSEHRIRVGPGRWSWVRARGRVVERDADGRALRVSGTARDINASRSAERERRVASEVLRSMAEAVAVFDRDFTFVSVNPAFARMTGYSDTEVIGRPTRVLDSPQHDAELYRHMRAELERLGHWSGELWQRRKDGSEFLCWLQASAVEDTGDSRDLYVAVLADVTDQKRAEQELRYLANYDTLTSLPNRTLLSERLSRAIVRARRHDTKIALLFLDLDRFKDINDSLGHATGDRILRAAASRLQQIVGPQHTVARLGGDEFTVVLERIGSAEQAEQVAAEIIRAFGAPLDIDDRQDLAISPSIGIALYPDHALVPTDLLKHADTAMYQAKAIGRRTFMRYHEGMDVEVRRRATISGALRNVIERNELRLVFQPRLSLRDERITGVEALLRWSSPEHGEIPPAQFIPLAEESGLILEIGEWVLHQACHMLRRWRDLGLTDLTMAVNVSALQLLRSDFTRVVANALEDSGVPANCLELELTESVLMANAQATAATLQAFRELGVGIAIDDFGTGYSSLAYLKRLPLSTLKIDKEFIGDITHDVDDEAITSTVITMAHSLGLTVVAEGVETPAQVQFLRDHGCDEVQGYWLARPLDPDACVAFIRSWTPEPRPAVLAP